MALLVVTPTALKDLTTIVFRDVASRAGRAFLDSRSRVPAFPHSWRFRHVGPRERVFFKARWNAEREEVER